MSEDTVFVSRVLEGVYEYVDSDGLVRRCYLSDEKVIDGFASKKDIESAKQYGVPFAEIIKGATLEIGITGEAIEDAFHKANIWTKEDMVLNRRAIIGALMSAYQLEASRLTTLVAEYDPTKKKSKKKEGD